MGRMPSSRKACSAAPRSWGARSAVENRKDWIAVGEESIGRPVFNTNNDCPKQSLFSMSSLESKDVPLSPRPRN